MANVQGVPTVVLEFSSGFLGICGVWYFHDEAVLLLPVALDFKRSCNTLYEYAKSWEHPSAVATLSIISCQLG
jgi:hypothetical protein